MAPQSFTTTEQAPYAPTEPASTEAIYRDRLLRDRLKELRSIVRHYPQAQASLARVESRLRYILRVIATWDASHARRAESLIRLGNHPAASTAAAMVFDEQLRADLLGRARIGGDAGADERVQTALELERMVIE